MKTLNIKTESSKSQIIIGEKLTNLSNYINPSKTIIITDTNLKKYYGDQFPNSPVIEIGTGEGNKTLQTVENVYRQLTKLNADRNTFIVAIGGGLVCDLAGFAASTYLRGLRFGFVSTSLLSQVDASVGGKNGVNLDGYKNMIGTFNQPEFVICDQTLFKTLPKEEFISGMGEVIKHAVIKDKKYFDFLCQNPEKILDCDIPTLEEVVTRSVEIKADVVSQDEKEHGERRKLNFGHTFGHAVEKVLGIAHGKAISIGMVVAGQISVERGLLKATELEEIKKLLQIYHLPISVSGDKLLFKEAMQKDKKRDSENIHFVLPTTLGNATVESISIQELNSVIDKL